MVSKLEALFKQTFGARKIMEWARQLGAVVRLRRIHPQMFCLSLVACALGDETRSIATARRFFARLTGFSPEESSFYDRFTEAMVALLRYMYRSALSVCTTVHRAQLAAVLGRAGLADMLAIDSTQILLPASAKDSLPSTDADRGGVKLTTTLSLLYQTVEGVVCTSAKTHDRKALKIGRWLHEQLLIFDRGYSDHKLFAEIIGRKGFFLTRLKRSSKPVISAIRQGLGQVHLGKQLTSDLPFRGVVDLDAQFSLGNGKTVTLRVVRMPISVTRRAGQDIPKDVWLVTNLSAECFTAEQIATLYRMRWDIETLFAALKGIGRLDQLRSASLPVITAFLYATLIGLVLAQDICAQMRRRCPKREPSLQRVYILVLTYLPEFVTSVGTKRFRSGLLAFEQALWREGRNPNPGRPYSSTRYALDVLNDA